MENLETNKKKPLKPFWRSAILPPVCWALSFWVIANLNLDFLYLIVFPFYTLVFLLCLLLVVINALILLIGWRKLSPDRKRVAGLWIVRPIVFDVLFLSIMILGQLSLHATKEYAKDVAKAVQAKCQANRSCPQHLEGWEPVMRNSWVEEGDEAVWRETPHSYQMRFNYGMRTNLEYSKAIWGNKESFVLNVFPGSGGRPTAQFSGGPHEQLTQTRWGGNDNPIDEVIE